MPTRRIGFLGFEGIQALDLVGPSDAFTSDALRSPEYTVDGEPPYEVVIVGLRAKRFAAASGLEFRAHYVVPSNVRLDTLIIPGGSGLRKTGLADEAAAWISARAPGIRRIASVCTGIYGLAPTGLLDGRAVTTHWSFAADVQRRFPKLRVDSDALYLKDGKFCTSAGVTAGVDMALAMIEDDMGPEGALAVAREMVVYHRRTGGQSQFSALQDLAPQSERMRAVLAHIGENLTADLDIDRLAEVACVSPRQFMRTFKAETGQTPAKAVERIRAEVARTHIEGGDSSIEAVARLTGFEDPERMRRAFVRVYGQPPQALRRMARAAAPAGAPRA